MQPTLPSHLLPRIDLVYAKTAAGRAELAQRSAGLTARQRAALIMLDGQRDATALHAVMAAEQVAPVLAALIALGLIAPPTVTLGIPPASSSLDAIKTELIAAANMYLGVMASDVILRVQKAADATQLLRMLGHWHMAMQDSKHGKIAAAALLEKTKAALQ
ncbi:MAG TPA: hypothetical protein VF663_02470 [Telluria sp.]